ncbi:hypothetical protein BJ166DRAFT_535732 [Pestalotiopsis sp. NC0098]|nr:hypothetical protein BJ166DRAFT_535732 [Pestalotiopsis sp. NC0098]
MLASLSLLSAPCPAVAARKLLRCSSPPRVRVVAKTLRNWWDPWGRLGFKCWHAHGPTTRISPKSPANTSVFVAI